jgi:hypothetical protein
MSWTVLVAAGVLGAGVLSQGLGQFGLTRPEVRLTAEPLPPAQAPEVPRPEPVVEERPAARVVAPVRPASPPALPASDESRDEESCRKLVARGESARAVDCFRALAQGQGIGAEVASYEAARITAEALHDAARTLQLLDEHTVRFPSGAMRGEVRWLRVRSLERAGRFDEALAESEALLATTEGRGLASDVHWLRARIYADARDDCQRAVSELVALVGEPGARGDEAEMRRAACLERMGRRSEASAAYAKYLERSEPRRADEARAKLEELRP